MSTKKMIISISDEEFDSWAMPLSCYMCICSKHTSFYGVKKHDTTSPHHDDFCHHCRIISYMKNTIATPGQPCLPSSLHHLRPFCSLVCSDSQYFARNHTISTKNFCYTMFIVTGSRGDGNLAKVS
jgi:hypothetical protein